MPWTNVEICTRKKVRLKTLQDINNSFSKSLKTVEKPKIDAEIAEQFILHLPIKREIIMSHRGRDQDF